MVNTVFAEIVLMSQLLIAGLIDFSDSDDVRHNQGYRINGKYKRETLHAKQAAGNTVNKNEKLIKAKQRPEAHKKEPDRNISMHTLQNKKLLQYNEVALNNMIEGITNNRNTVHDIIN